MIRASTLLLTVALAAALLTMTNAFPPARWGTSSIFAPSSSSSSSNSATPRLRRGFKSSTLATALNFGKRSGGYAAGVASMAPDMGMAERYPISWVAELVATNPAVAAAVVDRYMDSDGDGFITVEELSRLL